MKKIIALFGLLALTVLAFSMNAEEPSAARVAQKVDTVQNTVKNANSVKEVGYSFFEIVGAYEELYQVSPKEAISLNEMLNKASFTTAKGDTYSITSLAVQHAMDESYMSSYAVTNRLGRFDENQVVDRFYQHLALPVQAADVLAEFASLEKAVFPVPYHVWGGILERMERVGLKYLALRKENPAAARQVAPIINKPIAIENGSRKITIVSYINMEIVTVLQGSSAYETLEAFQHALEEDIK